MCLPSVDPVSLGINAAMIGGGAGLGMAGAKKDKDIAENARAVGVMNEAEMANARNKATSDYLVRQRAFQNENAPVNAGAIDQYSTGNQGQMAADAEARRVGGVEANLAPLSAGDYADIPVAGDAPGSVKQAIAGRMLDGFRRSTDNAKSMAKVKSFGDVWANNALGTADAGRRVDTVNSFSRGETALLPQIQEFAAYDKYRPADAYSGLGGAPYTLLGNIFAGYGGKNIGGAFSAAKPAGPNAVQLMPSNI